MDVNSEDIMGQDSKKICEGQSISMERFLGVARKTSGLFLPEKLEPWKRMSVWTCTNFVSEEFDGWHIWTWRWQTESHPLGKFDGFHSSWSSPQNKIVWTKNHKHSCIQTPRNWRSSGWKQEAHWHEVTVRCLDELPKNCGRVTWLCGRSKFQDLRGRSEKLKEHMRMFGDRFE